MSPVPLGCRKQAVPQLIWSCREGKSGLCPVRPRTTACALSTAPGASVWSITGAGYGGASVKLGPRLRSPASYRCPSGDGTQDIYCNPTSSHLSAPRRPHSLSRHRLYGRQGGPGAYGLTVASPPPGTGDEGLLFVVSLVLPILKDWKPDLIIGVNPDNHFTDPLANMMTAQGYAALPSCCSRISWFWRAIPWKGSSLRNVRILLALAGLDYTKWWGQSSPQRLHNQRLPTTSLLG